MRIFISYARVDGHDTAEKLAHRLRAIGHEVFLDIHSIVGGSRWRNELDRRIASAEVVIILVTPGSNQSDHVYMEFKQAEARGRLILPVQIGDTPLPVHLRGTWQAVRLDGEDLDGVLLEIERITRTLPRRRIGWLPVVGGLALVTGIAAIVIAVVLSRSGPAATLAPATATPEALAAIPTTLAPSPGPTTEPTPSPTLQAVFAQATVSAYAEALSFDPPQNVQYLAHCADVPYSTIDSGLCIHSPWGGPPQQIFDDPDLGLHSFAWDPSGERVWLALIEPDSAPDNPALYVMDTDGANLTRISGLRSLWPAISPDGQWVAVHDCDLVVMRSDGSDWRILWIGQGRGCVGAPQWSPDSQWIMVSVDAAVDLVNPTDSQIWLFARDGSAQHMLFSAPFDPTCDLGGAVFSPDQQQAAIMNSLDGQCGAYLLHISGEGDPVPILELPFWWGALAYPQWGGIE